MDKVTIIFALEHYETNPPLNYPYVLTIDNMVVKSFSNRSDAIREASAKLKGEENDPNEG